LHVEFLHWKLAIMIPMPWQDIWWREGKGNSFRDNSQANVGIPTLMFLSSAPVARDCPSSLATCIYRSSDKGTKLSTKRLDKWGLWWVIGKRKRVCGVRRGTPRRRLTRSFHLLWCPWCGCNNGHWVLIGKFGISQCIGIVFHVPLSRFALD
jgi:hypothetical protein